MTAGGDAHPTHSVGDYAHAIGRNQGREAILWAGAATLVLALHAGVAAWALHRRVEPAGLAVPPGAVMIDLAPEPEAPVAEESQISEQLEDVAPSETREPVVPTPEESMETVDAPDPIEDIPPTEEPPAEQAEIAPLESPVPDEQTVELPEVERAEVVLPEAPGDRQKAEDVRKEVAAPPKKAPPPESVRATAKPVSSAAGTAKWQTRLMAHLERRKRYPPALKRDRIEGVARVRFSVDTAGNVTSVSLARSSGVPELDAEVVAMVRRASPVPTPPPGATLNITVPVSFTIR